MKLEVSVVGCTTGSREVPGERKLEIRVEGCYCDITIITFHILPIHYLQGS